MKLRLHPVNHNGPRKNRFCGPSALSILTGLDTGRTATLLRRVSGARSIKGTYSGWMRKALRELGIDSFSSWTGHWTGGKPLTFVQWLRDTKDKRGDGTYLIVCGNHWILVQGRRCACGITKEVVSLKDCSKRRGRVTECWSLTRVEQPDYDKIVPQFKAPVDTERKPRTAAKALAAQHGIIIEVGDPQPDCIYIHHPALEEESDPHSGDHYVYSWGEALGRVNDYIEALKLGLTSPVESAKMLA